MITRTELCRLWEEIVPQPGMSIGRRADPDHPLDFFITFDEQHNMQLILLTEYQLSLPDSSKQLLVRSNKRADGRNAICFSLEDNQLRDQFISLSWDIMDSTYYITNKKVATHTAIKRFRMWQLLFAETKTRKLSETEIKGLIGELSVLKEICIPKYGIKKAISGWVGPLGADRDFEYDNTWYEAKFVSLSTDKVKISSLDQLDTDQRGYLILCRYEKSAETTTGYVTLNSLIYDISKMADADENTLVLFMNRLTLTGYKKEDDCAEQPYLFHRHEVYIVEGDSFPRLRRSTLPTAISEGEYRLSIPALMKWKAE